MISIRQKAPPFAVRWRQLLVLSILYWTSAIPRLPRSRKNTFNKGLILPKAIKGGLVAHLHFVVRPIRSLGSVSPNLFSRFQPDLSNNQVRKRSQLLLHSINSLNKTHPKSLTKGLLTSFVLASNPRLFLVSGAYPGTCL